MDKLDNLQLYNDDCFNVFPQIEDNTVNLFVLDLPYNQTACKWDQDIIPLDEMWKHIKRIMKPNGIVIHFCTAKFGYRLIHSNPKWFRYDLIWKKSRKVGFLSANKMPLRQHENIYLFKPEQGTYNPQKTKGKPYTTKGSNSVCEQYSDGGCKGKRIGAINTGDRHPTSIIEQKDLGMIEGGYYRGEGKKPFKRMAAHPTERHPTSIIDHENLYVFSNDVNEDYNDLDISRNKDLRQYAQKVKDYIGKTKTEIIKDIGQTIDHFFRITSSQFAIPTETTYNKLIELYKLDEMPEFIPYETLNGMVEKPPPKIETTYNPQKIEGKPYKSRERIEGEGVYIKENYKRTATKDTTNRHPSSLIDYDGDSILIYKNPHKTIHRTQKPVELLEWLIKTYSNEEETVMDFTMGSGTAAIACLNTNRKFIGIEKDPEIYEKAQDRIAEYIMN